ncbi:MAG: M20/M25/M40 family metallo-hydrolase [Acidobacteriia bacterium]|nr:M20/M25/M40 family metallo-hydrolase [Terriglobia bacterium]
MLTSIAVAQSTPDLVRAWVAAHQHDILREYVELLSIPNVASDSANIRRNAEHIADMLRRRGTPARLLEELGGPPLVYGELASPGATHTLIIYAHYDGQHVDAAQWASPPWSPTLRDNTLVQGGKEVPLNSLPATIPGEWRLYARSVSDDKAPIEAVVAALDALKATGAEPSVNLKFLFEGEEEAGSPHLAAAMEKYSELLKADAWLLCDGPVHQTRRMQVYFGARGMTDLEITVYGPLHALHSGHYGNWAPNPAALLAELLASMRDENANITIAGYYHDVRALTEPEKQAIAAAPAVDTQLRRELGLAWTEGESEPLMMRIMHPAINIRGLDSGNVGDKAMNAIPTQARASIDFRLVPDQQPERVHQLVEAHVAKLGFYIVHQAPTPEERLAHGKIVLLNWGSGYPAARTSMDLPVSRAAVHAIESALGTTIVKAPTLGGSVPIYLFLARAPVIGVPIVNHDNNQHAKNENLRLQNLWDGIQVFAGLMTGMAGEWR